VGDVATSTHPETGPADRAPAKASSKEKRRPTRVVAHALLQLHKALTPTSLHPRTTLHYYYLLISTLTTHHYSTLYLDCQHKHTLTNPTSAYGLVSSGYIAHRPIFALT
jgi:hypothetical protein